MRKAIVEEMNPKGFVGNYNTISKRKLFESLHNSNYGLRISKDQANKSARGMPWHQEPMKDVISCDKLR